MPSTTTTMTLVTINKNMRFIKILFTEDKPENQCGQSKRMLGPEVSKTSNWAVFGPRNPAAFMD